MRDSIHVHDFGGQAHLAAMAVAADADALEVDDPAFRRMAFTITWRSACPHKPASGSFCRASRRASGVLVEQSLVDVNDLAVGQTGNARRRPAQPGRRWRGGSAVVKLHVRRDGARRYQDEAEDAFLAAEFDDFRRQADVDQLAVAATPPRGSPQDGRARPVPGARSRGQPGGQRAISTEATDQGCAGSQPSIMQRVSLEIAAVGQGGD